MQDNKLLTEIQTSRLFMRRYNKEDIKDVLNLFLSNGKRLIEVGVITEEVYNMNTDADASLYISKIKTAWLFKKFFTFGIWSLEDGKLIGEYKIFNLDWNEGIAEVGGFIDYKYEGKFLFKECGKAIAKYVFETLRFNEILVSCRKDNSTSLFVMNRSGQYKKKAEIGKSILFSTTKETYFNFGKNTNPNK